MEELKKNNPVARRGLFSFLCRGDYQVEDYYYYYIVASAALRLQGCGLSGTFHPPPHLPGLPHKAEKKTRKKKTEEHL